MNIVRERTRVAIIGAGPAGLLLSHLLHREGIASIVLEQRSREHCLARVRAGVLEHDVAELLGDAGVGARMYLEGLEHDGLALQVDGRRHRVDLAGTTGKHVTVYGQQELVRDLIEQREADGGHVRFEVEHVRIHDHTTDAPFVTFRQGETRRRLDCLAVAGCDGFHGISRQTLSPPLRGDGEVELPHAWLGILAEAAPAVDELVYASHPNGFALYSMRSPAVSRLYLQVPPGSDLADWPPERIWDELDVRLALADDPAWRVARGPVLETSITPMRAFVAAGMQEGRLFLAGDAAHIVPPTGAKGLNLALRDVARLAPALARLILRKDEALLAGYGEACLARARHAAAFSRSLTDLLHVPADPAERPAQLERLRATCASPAALAELAASYVGVPDAALRP